MNWEINFLNWVNMSLHSEILDTIMIAVTTLGNIGLIWIVLAGCLIFQRKYRRIGVAVAVALILELVICNIFLKPWVARIRPYDVNTMVELLIGEQLDYSFPSGHTAAAFAAAAALYCCSSKLWKPVTVLAVLMAFSRLYLYVHYPTDVLAGGLIGILCGVLAGQLVKKQSRK